jgi:hypothetical protein
MPWVGLEPTIPVSERAKTVHALDRAATVNDPNIIMVMKSMGNRFVWDVAHMEQNTNAYGVLVRSGLLGGNQ